MLSVEGNTAIANVNPIRYRGYYYDEETGLYFLKTRYYDPEIGRFITIDDISYLAPDTINDLNLYAYCGNNPVMWVDPNGTNKFTDFWRSVGNWIKNKAIDLAKDIVEASIGFGLIAFSVGAWGGLQLVVSALSYIGMAIGAIFSKDIRADMNAIGWNPFNSNEETVVGSSRVSFYKGVPVFRSNKKRSGTFL